MGTDSSSTGYGANSTSQENGKTSNAPLYNGKLLFNVLPLPISKSFNEVGYCFSPPLENEELQQILNYLLKFTSFTACLVPPGKKIPIKYTSDEIFNLVCLKFFRGSHMVFTAVLDRDKHKSRQDDPPCKLQACLSNPPGVPWPHGGGREAPGQVTSKL